MTYTDDVNYVLNPFKGMMFTEQAETTDGDWAQYGCFDHIDYTIPNINPEVFIAIISGDKATVQRTLGIDNPKVLNATENDTVFTYFIDHGELAQIFVGPSVVSEERFINALKVAHDNHLYGKWVWFMEACHGGSMFANLPASWNIFAMTSADMDHIAKMSECPPDDVVAKKHLMTCMGGLWDNVWMDYWAAHPSCTIGEIVDATMKEVGEVSDQNVSQFGAMALRDLPLSEFIGEMPARHESSIESSNESSIESSNESSNESSSHSSYHSSKRSHGTLVDRHEVPLHLAKWAAVRAEDDRAEALAEFQRLRVIAARREVEAMRLGVSLLGEKAALHAWEHAAEAYNVDCVRTLGLGLEEHCGSTRDAMGTMQPGVTNLLKNVCLPGVRAPEVDWDEVCM